MGKNKYGAKKTVLDGITFDSIKESRHYSVLKLREKSGEIRNLEIKPVYEFKLDGKSMFKMIPDFAFFEGEKRVIHEVKSAPTKTRVYRLKKKIIEAVYKVVIVEI